MAGAPDNSPLAALQDRPAAQAFRVEELIAAVRAGRVRIPKFQRGLKWELVDVLSLLDSIYRGYPVGTLLLWRRPAGEDRIIHGSVQIDAPAVAEALWVVDGQQRIVSLTRTLTGAGFPEEPFAAFFDLHLGVFVRPRRRETPPSYYLPLTEALDSERLLEWLFINKLPTAERAAAIRVGKRLREFDIPAYVVATDDEGAVREIFRRANNTGKRMDDSDVFNALYSAGGVPASLGDIAESLQSVGLGRIDDSTLYNMMRATRGKEARKGEALDLSQPEARQAMADLMSGSRATLGFLRDDAHIPHLSLLPYQQPLLALVRFFHRHPTPHPRSRELLARWLWRGALLGVHGGMIVQTRQMFAAIGDDEHVSVQALLATLPQTAALTNYEAFNLEGYSFSHARCKIQLLALLDLCPVDVRTGVPVFDAEVLASEAPFKSMVRSICSDAPDPLGHLAKIMFHPSVSGGLAHAVMTCDEPALLASHAISDDARRAFKFGRLTDFLALRIEALMAAIDGFAARRGEWDEADTPPVEALRVENV